MIPKMNSHKVVFEHWKWDFCDQSLSFAHSLSPSMLSSLASFSQICQCVEFWVIFNFCKLWNCLHFKWLNGGEISIAPFERCSSETQTFNNARDAHPPACQSGRVQWLVSSWGQAGEQRSQASYEAKVWDSLLVVITSNKTYFFFVSINV